MSANASLGGILRPWPVPRKKALGTFAKGGSLLALPLGCMGRCQKPCCAADLRRLWPELLLGEVECFHENWLGIARRGKRDIRATKRVQRADMSNGIRGPVLARDADRAP